MCMADVKAGCVGTVAASDNRLNSYEILLKTKGLKYSLQFGSRQSDSNICSSSAQDKVIRCPYCTFSSFFFFFQANFYGRSNFEWFAMYNVLKKVCSCEPPGAD